MLGAFFCLNTLIINTLLRRLESRPHAIDGQHTHSVSVERFAFHQDSGNADEVESVFGKWHAVGGRQYDIDDTALVGNEEKRAPSGGAEFCAEGVIVAVGVSALKTIGVGEFAMESCDLATNRAAGQKFDVPGFGHFLGFGQIKDETLDLSEGHVVQAIVIAELESGQKQYRERTKGSNQKSIRSSRSLPSHFNRFARQRFFALSCLCS